MTLGPDPSQRRAPSTDNYARTVERGRRLRRRRRVWRSTTVVVALVGAGTGLTIAVSSRVPPHVEQVVQQPAPSSTATGSPLPTPVRPPTHVGTQPLDVYSYSFVSTEKGFVLASKKDCQRPSCAVLLTTTDGGRSWTRRTTPGAAVGAIGPASINHLDFANDRDGFAWGGALFATHDGGSTWRQVDLGSGEVVSLTTGGGRVYAVIDPCGRSSTSCGTGYLAAGPASSGPVRRVMSGIDLSGNLDLTTLVARDASAWLVVPAQGAPGFGAPIFYASSDGSAFVRRATPCPADEAFSFDLAASDATHLVSVCASEPGAGTQPKQVFVSSTAGRTWRRVSDPPQTSGSQLAVTSAAIYLDDRNGIEVTRDGGRTWRAALSDGAGGNDDVGFVDDDLGFVVSFHRLQVTRDAGRTWRAVPLPLPRDDRSGSQTG